MRITAKVDYAVRAAIALARTHPSDGGRPAPVTRQHLAEDQAIPSKFLEHILRDLKRAGLVGSSRGADGGYWLQRSPDDISVADVIRAVEGPLADVRGVRPDGLDYPAELAALQRTWIALRANLRAVLEEVSVGDLCRGELPAAVDDLASSDDAWLSH